jgi:hypothetical protein
MHRRTFLQRTINGSVAGALLADHDLQTAVAKDGDAKKPPIKIAQIGTGHAHASKLSLFRDSPDYEVIAVAEPDAELRKKAQSQELYRGLPWMAQEELLKTPGLRMVLVETRVRDLLITAEACVAAGTHIHLDKPAGESLPHLRRISIQRPSRSCWCSWATCSATTRPWCCCGIFSGKAGWGRCSRSTR